MSTNGQDERTNLLAALDALWRSSQEVRQYDLRLRPEKISHEYGGWTVPVASGNQTVSGLELSRAIGLLQEKIEQATRLNVYVSLTGPAQ